MLKANVLTEENQAVPEISPEYLVKLRKEDMKQAIVERFRTSKANPEARKAVRPGSRSAHWRPADEEC